MLKLTQELFGGQDPSQTRGVSVEAGLAVLMDFMNYFTAVVEDRKKNPTGDLASVLANALVDGAPTADDTVGVASATRDSYTVTAQSRYNSNTFSIQRTSAGKIVRTCTGTDGGCRGGSW